MIHKKPYDHPEWEVVKLNSPVLMTVSWEESFFIPDKDFETFTPDDEIGWIQ